MSPRQDFKRMKSPDEGSLKPKRLTLTFVKKIQFGLLCFSTFLPYFIYKIYGVFSLKMFSFFTYI